MSGVELSIIPNVTDILNHANSIVHEDIYALNKEFYEGYQWIAALDSTTCLACAALDNIIYDKLPGMPGEGTEPPDIPPLHHHCRCVIVPVLEGMRDDPSQTQINYKDWFDGQDDAAKLDILGPSRYAEYKNGKAVTAFAKDGRVLSLKELGIDRITRKGLLEKTGVPDDPVIPTVTDSKDYKNNIPMPKELEPLTNDQWETIIKDLQAGKSGFYTFTQNGAPYTVMYDTSGISIGVNTVMSRDELFNVLAKINPAIENPKDGLEKFLKSVPGMKSLSPAEKTEIQDWIKNGLNTTLPGDFKAKNPDLVTKYAKMITDQWGKLPDQLQRMLYDTKADITYGQQTYFLPGVHNLKHTLSISQLNLKTDDKGVYAFFHELGHALDWRIGEISRISGGGFYTGSAYDFSISARFYDTAKRNYDAVIDKLKKDGTLSLYLGTNKEATNPLYGERNRALSDVFAGFSTLDHKKKRANPVYHGDYWHFSPGYYNNISVLNELFADLVADSLVNRGLQPLFTPTYEEFYRWVTTGQFPK
jgi:hypothetical protein